MSDIKVKSMISVDPHNFGEILKALTEEYRNNGKTFIYFVLESNLMKLLAVDENRKTAVITQILQSAIKIKRTRLSKKKRTYYEQELFGDII